jgi:hypothetical protein
VRLGLWFENFVRRANGNGFRTFLHDPAAMQQVLERGGFELVSRRDTPAWSADVFVKHSGGEGAAAGHGAGRQDGQRLTGTP